MKGSLIVVGFFALGCLLGWSGWLPDVVIENDITVYVLYLLMFQVGLSIGSDKKLKDILGSIRPKLLLVPLATIAGTLVFSALVGLLLTQWSVFDCLAVGSGFAYYSLSSILITQLKEPFFGCPTRYRIRDNRFNGKYHARDYGSSRCASFCQIFRPVVSYLCWRCHDYGYDLACHHSLFGKRPCFHFNFSWDYRRFYGSVFCVVLLLVLDMVPFLLKYVTYFASNRQKKC